MRGQKPNIATMENVLIGKDAILNLRMGITFPDDQAPEVQPEPVENGQSLTDQVIAATGPKAHPRLAQIMPSLVRHLHEFAREVNLTVPEWMAAVDMVCDTDVPVRNSDGF